MRWGYNTINMRFILPLLLAITIFIVDRITKMLALTYCLYSSYRVNAWLSFDVIFNRGVSWGLFNDANTLFVFLIAIIQSLVIVLLSYYAYKSYRKNRSMVGYICIITGTLSNMFDRLLYPGVIDFITIGYKEWTWPTFNIADTAIVCGVAIVVWNYQEK